MSIIRLGGVISSSRLPSADPAKWIDAPRVARMDDVYCKKTRRSGGCSHVRLSPAGRHRDAHRNEDPGVAEGQEVEIQITLISKPARKTGKGFLRTAGALADDPYRDAIMAQMRQVRRGGEQ